MLETNKRFTSKVVVFAVDQYSINTLDLLLQQQQLAAVVIMDENSTEHQLNEQQKIFNQQLKAWLKQVAIPCFTAMNNKNTEAVEQLQLAIKQVQANIGLNFGFAQSTIAPYSKSFELGIFSCKIGDIATIAAQDKEINQQQQITLYWKIRNMRSKVAIYLQKYLNGEINQHENVADIQQIASHQVIDITPLDTLGSIDNIVIGKIPQLIHNFLETTTQQQGHISLNSTAEIALSSKNELSTIAAAQNIITNENQSKTLTEHDLKIFWQNMNSQQITSLVRAGNPHYGGGVITLNNVELNLLQATEVDYQTYGVPAGTICHSGEPHGVIVACKNGAVRLDIISNADGFYSANNFCQRFEISAGMAFS